MMTERPDYLLILDFEATCNDKEPKPRVQEIIEFPTLVLNVKTGEVESEFHHYINPSEKLTPFCTELTGITQKVVDGGISISKALELHKTWVFNDLGLVAHPSSEGHTFLYCTCGDWDLKRCLPAQLASIGATVPQHFSQWINIKIAFGALYGLKKKKRAKGMVDMLDKLGLELEGRHHSGIDDCRNIARVASKMLADGWIPEAT